MSWLGSLATRTENLLNKVDQVAGQALHKESGPEDDRSSPWLPPQKFPEATQAYSPFLTTAQQKQNKSSLNEIEEGGGKKQRASLKTTPTGSNLSQKLNDRQAQEETSVNKGVLGSKDADSELFEFLNNSSESDALSKKDSRPPSVSSNRSTHSRKTPDHPESTIGVTVGNENNLRSDGGGNSIPNSSSSNHPDEDQQEVQQQNSASLETENQLLKNEIMSLNREMESAIRRIQSTQEELSRIQKKLDRQAGQLSKSDQITRELQSRESDMQEALTVKDSQLALLRTRLDEADQSLSTLRKQIAELQHERDSILKDQSLSTDVQGHALDTLQDKLNEAEAALRHQQEIFHRTENETLTRQTKLESDKQMLMAEVSTLQKNFNAEKAANADLSSQLRNARTQTEAAKNELTEYKDKAQRILQSKDRLITSLKEGSGGSGVSGEAMVHATELDSMRQERDIAREEHQNSQLALENLRSELSEMENQMQQDNEASQDQISSLEDQLRMERKRREDGELEMNKVKQELRFVHEEFIKQKSAFQTRLQDRENEISRLRNQLTTKSTNATSQEELENRLHSLTESLIQKQTTLEALSTEKNSLVLQLERMEKQYHEAEASALRATAAAAITINDDEDVRPRGGGGSGGGFMNESPLDGNVTRRVKLAANTIDKFSIRLGLFLRRYPIARIFIIVYMGLLHLWVMIVLLTYEPEIHTSHNLPHDA